MDTSNNFPLVKSSLVDISNAFPVVSFCVFITAAFPEVISFPSNLTTPLLLPTALVDKCNNEPPDNPFPWFEI